MRVVVINMPDAPDRMAFQRYQLSRLSMPFSRLNAFTAQTVTHTHHGQSDLIQPLTLSERASLLSHRTVWEEVAANGPALIVEDDTILADSVPDIVRNVETMPDIDHLSLAVRGHRKLLGMNRIPVAHGGISIRRLYLDWHGRSAYVLWPDGAKKLIARADRGASTVDWLIGTAFDLKSYQTDPACALQLDMLAHYDLADEARPAARQAKPVRKPMTPLQWARNAKSVGAKAWRRVRYAAVARPVAIPVLPESFSF